MKCVTPRAIAHSLIACATRRRDVEVELLSVADGGDELGVDVLRQLVAHLAHAKGVDAEVFGGALGRGRLSFMAAGVRTSRSVISREHRLAGRYGGWHCVEASCEWSGRLAVSRRKCIAIHAKSANFGSTFNRNGATVTVFDYKMMYRRRTCIRWPQAAGRTAFGPERAQLQVLVAAARIR